MRTGSAALVVSLCFGLPTAAQAEEESKTTVFASKNWSVTHYTRNYDGNPMCSMQSQISLANGAIGLVRFSWTEGRSNPFIQLSKSNWQFAPDLQIPFSIKLDSGSREFAGVSRNPTTSRASSIIGYLVKDEGRGSDWLDDFASSEAMTIKFHSGNEPQWSVKMAGSRDAEKSFRSCISKLGGENTRQAATTSPVPEATQPAQSHQGSIALKSGESVALGDLWYVVNCESILIGPPEVEILEGPP